MNLPIIPFLGHSASRGYKPGVREADYRARQLARYTVHPRPEASQSRVREAAVRNNTVEHKSYRPTCSDFRAEPPVSNYCELPGKSDSPYVHRMAELRKVHQKPCCGSEYPRGKTVLLLQRRPQYDERQRKRPSQPSVGQKMHAEHFLGPHKDSQGLVIGSCAKVSR
jgi:hypothetical protein